MSSKSFLSVWFSNYNRVAYAFLFPTMFVTHLNQTMCLVWLPKYHCMENGQYCEAPPYARSEA
jgi:hypothetical protein